MQKNEISIITKDVKNVNLRVKPNKQIILTIPRGTTDKEIEYIIEKKSNWIQRQLNIFSKNQVTSKELVSGEEFIYLGKNYRLKIIESFDEKANINGSYFEIYLKDKNDYKKKERLIHDWYKTKANEYMNEAIKKYINIVNVEIKKVRIRVMKSRWGSCNPKKSYINLNLELIKKNKSAIEYVVFHELTHLLYPNHDKKFYNYLSLHMPDWKKRKKKLE